MKYKERKGAIRMVSRRDTIPIHGRPQKKHQNSKVKPIGSCSQIVPHTPLKTGNT